MSSEGNTDCSSLEKYIQEHIDEAIEKGWIRAYYQPVIRTMNGKIAGYEALARWEEPEKGMLMPKVVVLALESCSSIYKLDLEILRQICKKYRENRAGGLENVPVSFNLSRFDFEIPDIHSRINDILGHFDVPHSMINIEIPENTSSYGDEILEAHIRRFHKDGYKVWMDDFGSGYSTFNTLQIHDFDTIKLDMLFLRNFNDKAEEIIRAVIKLAKKLNMRTVCEGVETEEQAEFLKSVGCELMQGWHFGMPQPIPALTAIVNAEKANMLETEEEQPYWDEISKQDMDTAEPWLLIEYCEGNCKIIDINPAMRRQIEEIHPEGYIHALREYTDPNNPLCGMFMGVLGQVAKTHESRYVDYIDSGFLILLTVTYIASVGNRTTLRSSIKNIHTDLEYRKNYLLDEGLIGMYSQYQLVSMLQPDKDLATQIYSNASFEKVYGKEGLRKGVAEFTATEVHPEDCERYKAFMDMDTLRHRMTVSGMSFMTEGFRLKEKSGNFRWALVTLLMVPSGSDMRYLYEIQEASSESAKELEKKFKNE